MVADDIMNSRSEDTGAGTDRTLASKYTSIDSMGADIFSLVSSVNIKRQDAEW